MEFNVTGCCFIDKYFEIIGTERGVSTKKDIGDDSDRNGYFEKRKVFLKKDCIPCGPYIHRLSMPLFQ